MRITSTNVGYKEGHVTRLSDLTYSFSIGMTYVVGKNGAGKSTLLKLLATAIQPTKGQLTYTKLIQDEHAGTYRRLLNIEEVRKQIGFLPQDFAGHSEMTVERYLTYMAYHKGVPRKLVKETVEKWLQETDLISLKRRRLKHISGGQRQKVGLIQALINIPRICILDEPFASLDIEERFYFQRVLRRLSFHSVVIMSTHLVEELQHVKEGELLYLKNGRLAFSGGMNRIELVLEKMKNL